MYKTPSNIVAGLLLSYCLYLLFMELKKGQKEYVTIIYLATIVALLITILVVLNIKFI